MAVDDCSRLSTGLALCSTKSRQGQAGTCFRMRQSKPALTVPAVALESVMIMAAIKPRLPGRLGRPNLNVLLAEYNHPVAQIAVPLFVYQHLFRLSAN